MIPLLQVAAHEQELDACQKRLAAREGEVRDVKELLQASLQPRMVTEPVPKLISLETAAAELGATADAQVLRKQAPFQIPRQALGGPCASIARDPTLSTWQAEQARAAVSAGGSTPECCSRSTATRQHSFLRGGSHNSSSRGQEHESLRRRTLPESLPHQQQASKRCRGISLPSSASAPTERTWAVLTSA